ncbi:hypothetical protein PHYC_03443 [Phycisphaerales bacterium]|nr:hypothetical protein PHYC_03443 [Phycisphaerales bacterium]
MPIVLPVGDCDTAYTPTPLGLSVSPKMPVANPVAAVERPWMPMPLTAVLVAFIATGSDVRIVTNSAKPGVALPMVTRPAV